MKKAALSYTCAATAPTPASCQCCCAHTAKTHTNLQRVPAGATLSSVGHAPLASHLSGTSHPPAAGLCSQGGRQSVCVTATASATFYQRQAGVMQPPNRMSKIFASDRPGAPTLSHNSTLTPAVQCTSLTWSACHESRSCAAGNRLPNTHLQISPCVHSQSGTHVSGPLFVYSQTPVLHGAFATEGNLHNKVEATVLGIKSR